MKAQMSLEMIIGLLILLVVAAVIISLFMNKIKEFTTMGNWQQDLEYRQFKSNCESFCKEGTDGSVAKYCSTKLNKKDLNGNKRVDVLPSDTSVLSMCEDAIYCFHVVKCDTEGGEIGAKECKEILCKSWSDIYGDMNSASTKVMELVPGYGTCTLNDNENWWRIAKFGPNPPCGGVVQAASSLNCQKSGSNGMTCVWSCPIVREGSLSVSGTTQVFTVSNTAGNAFISNLEADKSYVVTLVCDANNPAYSATQTVRL